MSAPEVSVVIPAHDVAAVIGEQLAALAAQRGAPRFEVVIADNGSSDGLAGAAAGFREDLEFILQSAPAERRTLMFSATVPPAIAKLATEFQKDALRIVAQGEARQHGVAVAAVPQARSGTASGLLNTGRMIGATMGIAILGALFAAFAGPEGAAGAGFLPGLRAAMLVGGSGDGVDRDSH